MEEEEEEGDAVDGIIGHFSERKGGSGNGQGTGDPTMVLLE